MDVYTVEIKRDEKTVAYYRVPVYLDDVEGIMKFTDDADEAVREITSRIYFNLVLDKVSSEKMELPKRKTPRPKPSDEGELAEKT